MNHYSRRLRSHTAPRRNGSTLLIVMVLMGMLSLLGVIFYTFTAQERSNSEYYSEAAKETGDPSLDADTLFDWALEQIIVGTDPKLKNSVLWGSRHSLLSNALGVGYHRPGDLHPFNGEGVNVIYDVVTGQLGVDQNRDGNIEPANAYLLDYVDSPAVRNLSERQLVGGAQYFPQTDVGYTYPDINNVFLCYVGKVRDQNGQVHQVVKPSYLVPSLLRNPATNAPNANWCVDSTLAGRVMRGHPSHLYVPPTTTSAALAPRYLTDAEAIAKIGPGSYGFPQYPMDKTYDTTTATGAVYTLGRMGPYTKVSPTPNAVSPNGDDPIEFDYDNDGDGIPESILIDLDFPPQQDSSGKLFVPLFLVTIHDLDALVNLNAHGNLNAILQSPNDSAQPYTPISNSSGQFGTDSSGAFNLVSRSNLGIGPAEVNPIWVLNRRVGTDDTPTPSFDYTQYKTFFGSNPALYSEPFPAWSETANIDLFWSKVGRLQYSSTGKIEDLYSGLYGEENILFAAMSGGPGNVASQLPRPGISGQDDNGDMIEGQGINPFFQHPIDYTGRGSILATPKLLTKLTSGANQWLTYSRYNNNSTTPASSNIKWGTVAGLMNNSITEGNRDDAYEVTSYPTDKRQVDNLFDPDEMLPLQLPNSEIDRLNVTSRLMKLMPFNLTKVDNNTTRGQNIRRKLTTIGNDRKNFGLPFSISGRTWEYSTDTAPFNPSTQGPYVRDAINTFRFPPQFGGVRRFTSITAGSTAPYTEDPLRAFTRALLEIDNDPNRSHTGLQRKLSVNHLFTYDPASGRYDFRPLMPHPIDPGTTPISTTYPPPLPNVPYPPTNGASQEYWARRDRQQMARDIYVLLYLLGHGDDSMDTSQTAGSTLYTDAQLREMAQFAVNLVDGMDRDNVITRFEYDKDLSDGWNLDDDPYGPKESAAYPVGDPKYLAAYPNDGISRGEVFGVERLDLSISEAMAIRTEKIMMDHMTATPFKDDVQHTFGYVELYNQSPFDVTFDSTESWQIAVIPPSSSGAERRLTFKTGTIASGQLYTIGSAEADMGTSPGKSTFQVDPTASGAYVKIAPYNNDANLDLLDNPSPATLFRIEDGQPNPNDKTTTLGEWMKGLDAVTSSDLTKPVSFQLRRRAHPTRSRMASSQTNDNDNPWVVVDELTLSGISQFALMTAMDIDTDIQKALDKVAGSRERNEPLDRGTEKNHSATKTNSSGSQQNNTLRGVNSNQSSPYKVWQPHFDRDYTSIIDLFILPVFGPHQLTLKQRAAMSDSPEGQLTDQMNTGYTGAKSAAAKFLVPEDPSNWSAVTSRSLDNRWHRLLEFIEVPTRTNKNLGVGSDLSIARVPGKMNLNMFRHAESLAALLDDSKWLTLQIDGTDQNGAPYHPADAEAGELFDRFEGTSRDWWDQFLRSRDKADPYWQAANGVSLPLPGTPGSKPFRSLADVSYNSIAGAKHASVEDTILRALPTDIVSTPDPMATSGTRRRLMEVGSSGEHYTGTTMQLDPMIRNRLLSKVANNTTTRSNCFAIFISVKYFAAVADPAYNGAVRIGGPLNGKPAPEHRGFFVVDRSKLEQGQYSGVPNYDFRTFVEYRKTLATQ